MAIWYTARRAKKELGLTSDPILSLTLWIIVSAFIGGKIFFFLESPSTYIADPGKMVSSLGAGFVFYGSLIFAIPAIIFFLRKNKIPVWQMFDILALTACIVHGFGRMGCFFAGCCHGLPSGGPFAIMFSNPECAADIKNVPVHPTQLYEVAMIIVIAAVLLIIRSRKKFNGQMFLVYIILYGIGRSIIEIYRGDPARGFIVQGLISYSQFISFILVITALVLYKKLRTTV